MTSLTKQHFDKQIKKLVTKQDLTTQLTGQSKELRGYTDKQVEKLASKQGLALQTKELKAHTDKQIERLARIVAGGFKHEREYWDRRLFDIYPKLENFEQRINRIERAVGIVVN